MKRIYLDEVESVELMKRATLGNALQCTFGPGWMALDPQAPNFRWALEQLAELRGVPINEQEDDA